MALTGVLRPGHAQVRVLDLDESVRFYKEVLGLVETGRDAQGRVYFKCWDERDHHSYVIREADRAGIDFFGFRVLDAATLDKLDADLKAYGLKTAQGAIVTSVTKGGAAGPARRTHLPLAPSAAEIRREIAALSESKRTESYWVRTRIFDSSGSKQVAEMLLNHATLKHSYANYEAERTT